MLRADQQSGSLIELQRGIGQPGDIMKVYITGQEVHDADPSQVVIIDMVILIYKVILYKHQAYYTPSP